MSQKFIKSKNNNLRSTAYGKYFAKAVGSARPSYQMLTQATRLSTTLSTPPASIACGRGIHGWESKLAALSNANYDGTTQQILASFQ